MLIQILITIAVTITIIIINTNIDPVTKICLTHHMTTSAPPRPRPS